MSCNEKSTSYKRTDSLIKVHTKSLWHFYFYFLKLQKRDDNRLLDKEITLSRKFARWTGTDFLLLKVTYGKWDIFAIKRFSRTNSALQTEASTDNAIFIYLLRKHRNGVKINIA